MSYSFITLFLIHDCTTLIMVNICIIRDTNNKVSVREGTLRLH
ncbi:unnamed protein product [Schistosoma mattheei]|uniref:Uncharacterized protein n=1 Tax=Schistosoma mattheei TaxID=31246 RepID=A0A183PZ26_9TREM|nr:unnamed protein product [Schistosoma mattheei]